LQRDVRFVAELEHVREITIAGDTSDGAQLLLIAADAAFHGIRFRELSISRVVSPERAVLLQAFNSVRFFAFCERVFFKTPYLHSDVRLGQTWVEAAGVFSAELREHRSRSFVGDESASYEVDLPNDRWFIARIEGMTERYPVIAADRFELRHPLLKNFTPREWIIRADARHAKSKTYAR
jgi:hypothetical protein